MVNAVKVFTLRLCISAYYIHFKRVKVKIFTAFTISGKLDKAVEEVITQGCEIVYTGAMGEFDRLFSSAVRKAKKIYPHIKLICVKPYFTAALHFNADKGVSFKTYAAAVIRNHLKKVMFTKKIGNYSAPHRKNLIDLT